MSIVTKVPTEVTVIRAPDGTHRYAIGIVALHPVQYHSPLYRRIAEHSDIDLEVLYLDTLGSDGVYDPDFPNPGWDVPLLEGYKHKFLRNYARNKLEGFLCRINPGLFRTIRDGGYDIVLVQGYSVLSNWIALIVARMFGIRIIWRGEVIPRPPKLKGRFLRSRVTRLAIAWYLRRCDAVMYSCVGNLEFLKAYGVPQQKLYAFPCAVDNHWFKKEYARWVERVASVRVELGITGSSMIVLFCGRLAERKRIDDVLNALAMVGPRDITLLVVGDGPLRSHVDQRARALGVNMVMVGFVNQTEIPKYYSIAEVLVLVSDYDPSPKVLNEAMNFEVVPIVSNGVGTAPDLVHDGQTGYIIEVADVEALADRLGFLHDNPDKRHELGLAAAAHVANYSFDADLDGLLKACHALTNC